MIGRKLFGRVDPWTFNQPVQVIREPGPLLLPFLTKHIPGSQLFLKAMARFKLTRRPSLVRPRFRVNERIVEVPFVMRNIEEEEKLILDIGCCESLLPLELAHLGFQVWGIDQRPYPVSHPNLKFIQGDICETDLPSDFFDVAITLSTLEHIGIGFYDDKQHVRGDVIAINRLWKALKPGGKLLLTAPFGRVIETWQRVYDSAAISKLLSDFRVETTRYFAKTGETWIESSQDATQDIDSSKDTLAIILVTARKPFSLRSEMNIPKKSLSIVTEL